MIPSRSPHSPEVLRNLTNSSTSVKNFQAMDMYLRLPKEPTQQGTDLLTLVHNLTIVFNNLSHDNIESDYYPDFSQFGVVRGLFVCLFLFEFVIGVVGNILVCVTVYRNKSMHSAVNYGILNLAFCDFLVGGFVLPTKLFELTASLELNMMNDLWCTVIRFLESVVVFVTVFTLVAICIERYYAVVFPMHSRIHMTSYRIRKILLLVWIIPIIVATPNLYPAVAAKHFLYSEYGEFTRLTCFDTFSDQFRLWYFLFLFCFIYLIPLLFIGTTCFSITRVAKMVLVIVLAFVVCWSPYFLVSVITQLQTENFLHNRQFFFTMLCINLCCFTNSCINPFIYFSMSKRFRTGFLGILQSMTVCSKSTGYTPGMNTRSLTSGRRSHGSHGGRMYRSAQNAHYVITATTAPRNKHCSCHRPHLRSMAQRSTCDCASISFGTPKSSINSQGQSASYHRRGTHNSSHTIVFEFHQLPQSPIDSIGPDEVPPSPFTPPPAYQESSFLL